MQRLFSSILQEFQPTVSFFIISFLKKDRLINPNDLLKNNKILTILFAELERNGKHCIQGPFDEGKSLSITCNFQYIEEILFAFSFF